MENWRKILEFLAYTLLIYGCYIRSGVYHEKILKHDYLNDINGIHENFQAAIVFTFFPQAMCAIIGFVLRLFGSIFLNQTTVDIPAQKAVVCSLVVTVNMLTYNRAVIEASFPAVVMVKSCSLLSVILVAIFCSRVRDKKLRLGQNKLWIGGLVTIGILLFNYFKITESAGHDKPITWISAGLLLISLLGDGFLPDLQAEIKSEFNPGTIDMYFHVNKWTCVLSLIYAAFTFQVDYIWSFLRDHKELQFDLFWFSLLNALGQLVVYRMVKLFRQHIPAFVIATRKCATVVVNIVYFHHTLVLQQIIALFIVFLAILLEVYQNYKEKQKEQHSNVKLDLVQVESEKLTSESENTESKNIDENFYETAPIKSTS